MNDKQIIIFHIGPVQDFIASARRSRDLWFGSWLLSELSKAAALEVVRKCGNEVTCLVFPAPNDLNELESDNFNVPNRVIALVNQKPDEIGKDVEKAILRRLGIIRDEAYGKIKGDFKREISKRQVEDMLEYFWVACPVNGNYSKARERAEALMACRKVTRNFDAVTWGSSDPKSSLDGERESVIPEDVYDHMSQKELRQAYGIRVGERLCGIGLLKRHGKRGSGEDRFFSTSHVAALPLLKHLSDKKYTAKFREATEKYIDSLTKLKIPSDALNTSPKRHPIFGHHDGHLLFEERLHEFFEKEEKDKIEEAKQALREFLKSTVNSERPRPYYALLLADGDRMGKIIDAQKTDEKHRALSQQLSRFAGMVAGIVEEHEGSLVYSGGDDVLAFLPLHRVLDCAHCLSDTFRKELEIFKVRDNGKGISPTLSVGIVIVHHLDPLSDAFALVRETEKRAKLVPGKNALALTVSKRSGIDRTTSDPWDPIYKRLKFFIGLHRNDAIPNSAAYELLDVSRYLDTPDLKEAQKYEALRILRRKEARHGRQNIAGEILSELEMWLEKGLSLEQIAQELIIARDFAAAMDQADMPLPIVLNKEAD